MREQVSRARQHRRGRSIEPAQVGGVARSPVREIERERREIGVGDLRRRKRRETALCAFAPRAIADTGFHPARTALALIRGGARDSLRFEPAHSGRRIEDGATHEPRIHDDADAGNRETRFRDVGCEHDLARAAGGRRERGVLLACRKVAEKG